MLFAGQYDNDLTISLLVAVALGLVPSAVVVILEVKLRSALRVRQILVARLAATVVLLIVGIGLTKQLELLGAAITVDLIYGTTFLAHWSMNLRKQRLKVKGFGGHSSI